MAFAHPGFDGPCTLGRLTRVIGCGIDKFSRTLYPATKTFFREMVSIFNFPASEEKVSSGPKRKRLGMGAAHQQDMAKETNSPRLSAVMRRLFRRKKLLPLLAKHVFPPEEHAMTVREGSSLSLSGGTCHGL